MSVVNEIINSAVDRTGPYFRNRRDVGHHLLSPASFDPSTRAFHQSDLAALSSRVLFAHAPRARATTRTHAHQRDLRAKAAAPGYRSECVENAIDSLGRPHDLFSPWRRSERRGWRMWGSLSRSRYLCSFFILPIAISFVPLCRNTYISREAKA